MRHAGFETQHGTVLALGLVLVDVSEGEDDDDCSDLRVSLQCMGSFLV